MGTTPNGIAAPHRGHRGTTSRHRGTTSRHRGTTSRTSRNHLAASRNHIAASWNYVTDIAEPHRGIAELRRGSRGTTSRSSWDYITAFAELHRGRYVFKGQYTIVTTLSDYTQTGSNPGYNPFRVCPRSTTQKSSRSTVVARHRGTTSRLSRNYLVTNTAASARNTHRAAPLARTDSSLYRRSYDDPAQLP